LILLVLFWLVTCCSFVDGLWFCLGFCFVAVSIRCCFGVWVFFLGFFCLGACWVFFSFVTFFLLHIFTALTQPLPFLGSIFFLAPMKVSPRLEGPCGLRSFPPFLRVTALRPQSLLTHLATSVNSFCCFYLQSRHLWTPFSFLRGSTHSVRPPSFLYASVFSPRV